MTQFKRRARWFCTLTAPCVLGLVSYDAVVLGRPWLAPLGLLPCAGAAVQWLTRERPPEPGKPPPPAREARYPQGAPRGTCPVCGMADPRRFALGIGVAEWNGWPAHESCVAWLDGGPKKEHPPSGTPVSWPVAAGTLATLTPAGYGWVSEGTCAYLVPLIPAQSTVSAASVPHPVGLIPDPCPDCGTDRNMLGRGFGGGRLCGRPQREHERRMVGVKIAQAISPRLAPGRTPGRPGGPAG